LGRNPFEKDYVPNCTKLERFNKLEGGNGLMETRIALIGIVVTSHECIDQLNSLLSEYGSYIIGRMGIPYKEKNVSVISITLDAPNDIISALSGKIGMLPGINTKTIYAKTN